MSQIKVVLAGRSGVGKTSLVNRMYKNTFNPDQRSTLGAQYCSIKRTYKKTDYVICIWDTAGQEKYHSIVGNFFRDAHVVLLVFDVSDRDSFSILPEWIKLIHNNAPPTIPVVLACNKCDLEYAVNQTDIDQFCDQNDIKSYLFTSAYDGMNIEELIHELLVATEGYNEVTTKLAVDEASMKSGCSC